MNDFIEAIKDGAIESYRQHGILPSISIAQAILESGWGKSKLAIEAKNLFGIKASVDWEGRTHIVSTQEFLGGKYITVNAAFRAYDSWADSIVDHGAFFVSTPWRVANYAAVRAATDYLTAARALQAAGYATDPEYAEKLIEVIERNGLQKYDEGLNKEGGNAKLGYKLRQIWLPESKYGLKATYPMTPKGIVVHNTAGSASARDEALYMLNNSTSTSFHVVVDESEAIEMIPFSRNAWHGGDGSNGYANRNLIGIEIARSTNGNQTLFAQAEANAAEYLAHVLKQYGWGTDALHQHKWYASTSCPHNTGTHWDEFKQMVQTNLDKLNEPQAEPKSEEPKEPDWQEVALKEVVAKKDLDLDYWLPKIKDNLTVGEVFGLLNKLL